MAQGFRNPGGWRRPGTALGIPAKGKRPPFTPGNLSAVTHGARSPRVYGALAEALAAGLVEDRPDLAAYPEAIAAWATAEAQAALIRRHVAERGPLDPDTGAPRDADLTWLTRLEGAAARHRATLGLDPRSEAALSRERAAASVLAVDLDALAERGREVLSARELAPPDLAGRVLSEERTAYAMEREAAAAERDGGCQ